MSETERRSLQQSLRETWTGARGVISGAEAEATRAAHRALESVGLHVESEAQAVKDALHELVERVRKNREELERRVDEGVKAAMARVHRPLADELRELRGRIEVVQKRVEHLASRTGKKGK